jgi:hypothetical protein
VAGTAYCRRVCRGRGSLVSRSALARELWIQVIHELGIRRWSRLYLPEAFDGVPRTLSPVVGISSYNLPIKSCEVGGPPSDAAVMSPTAGVM